MNRIPGRYLPVKDEICWARFDVLRRYRRAVVTDIVELAQNRTRVHFVWLEDDLDPDRPVEAGAYGRVTVPTVDRGEAFPDVLQPWARGDKPLIRMEKDWRTDVPSLPADGTVLTYLQSAKRLNVTPMGFVSMTHSYEDFPPAHYHFEHRMMWRASELDEWRARHPSHAKDPWASGTRSPTGRRAMRAKKRGGPGYGTPG